MTRRKTKVVGINVIGQSKSWYWRWEVRVILGCSEATLKRYISILQSELPAEFDWVPRSAQFSEMHLHYLKSFSELIDQTKSVEAARKRLQNEGVPDVSYQASA